MARIITSGLALIELPPLEIGEKGNIASLVPESSSATLEDLAARCVRAFEGTANG